MSAETKDREPDKGYYREIAPFIEAELELLGRYHATDSLAPDLPACVTACRSAA